MASCRTLCLGDASICSSSEVPDTDESDVADIVWYVPLFPRAVVSGAQPGQSCANLLPALSRVQKVSACEERRAELPATP